MTKSDTYILRLQYSGQELEFAGGFVSVNAPGTWLHGRLLISAIKTCPNSGHMNTDTLGDERRWTGVLFIQFFVLFAMGGLLPVMGDNGSICIFILSAREHLLVVANNPTVWRWVNISWAPLQ